MGPEIRGDGLRIKGSCQPSLSATCLSLRDRLLGMSEENELPESIRNGLIVTSSKILLIEAILVFTSFSLVATSSLLLYLLFKKVQDKRDSPSRVYSSPIQGTFWLINLFVAG